MSVAVFDCAVPAGIMNEGEEINSAMNEKENILTGTRKDAIRSFLLENPIEGLNISGALERFGDSESWLESARTYAACTPDLLVHLKLAGDDLDIYRITARWIKSSSYSISADKIGAEAEKIENATRRNDIEFIRCHSADFLADAENFVRRLKSLVEGVDSGGPDGRKPETSG
jgi:hypothetical protein